MQMILRMLLLQVNINLIMKALNKLQGNIINNTFKENGLKNMQMTMQIKKKSVNQQKWDLKNPNVK